MWRALLHLISSSARLSWRRTFGRSFLSQRNLWNCLSNWRLNTANFGKGCTCLLGSVYCRAKKQNWGRKDSRQEGGVPAMDQGARKVTETLPVPLRSNKYLSPVGTVSHCSIPEYVFQGFFHWHELSKSSWWLTCCFLRTFCYRISWRLQKKKARRGGTC